MQELITSPGYPALFGRFALFVFAGKFARYVIVAWLTPGGMGIFANWPPRA
ncbi:MAG: hypothetical protein IH628_14890 [Proteobacteria bacterium]|nr:hypothetical protein [Pseudomonadota bacterium]